MHAARRVVRATALGEAPEVAGEAAAKLDEELVAQVAKLELMRVHR